MNFHTWKDNNYREDSITYNIVKDELNSFKPLKEKQESRNDNNLHFHYNVSTSATWTFKVNCNGQGFTNKQQENMKLFRCFRGTRSSENIIELTLESAAENYTRKHTKSISSILFGIYW